MEEERKGIKGYEEIYDITRFCRIVIKRNNRAPNSDGNEFGKANVHINKNGERKLYKTFGLWKIAFSRCKYKEYKGMKSLLESIQMEKEFRLRTLFYYIII